MGHATRERLPELHDMQEEINCFDNQKKVRGVENNLIKPFQYEIVVKKQKL